MTTIKKKIINLSLENHEKLRRLAFLDNTNSEALIMIAIDQYLGLPEVKEKLFKVNQLKKYN